ncbi:unnamed protein product, partial [Mycena citricolor]
TAHLGPSPQPSSRSSPTMQSMIHFPPPHRAIENAEDWNDGWEKVLRLPQLAPARAPYFVYGSMLHNIRMDAEDAVQDMMFHLDEMKSLTLSAQRMLAIKAVQHLANDDFERRWLEASPAERRKHLMLAFVKSCGNSDGLNSARTSCGVELRLTRLRLLGRAFIDLLQSAIMLDGTMTSTEPKRIANPDWDRFEAKRKADAHATNEEKLALAQVVLLRTRLICQVLTYTLDSFHGNEIKDLVVLKDSRELQKRRASKTPEEKEIYKRMYGLKLANEIMSEEDAGKKERLSHRQLTCSRTGCPARVAELNTKGTPAIKFLRCSQCWVKLKRQVSYCSRECQKEDWSLRHKAICGKAMDFEMASSASSSLSAILKSSNVAPSDILANQIELCTSTPCADYFILSPEKFDFEGISFAHTPSFSVAFRKCRDHAFETRDPTSLARMAHFLCWSSLVPGSERAGVTPRVIVVQLAMEFQTSPEGLNLGILGMQKLQKADPWKRPPLLHGTPPDDWEEACAPEWKTVVINLIEK